MFWKFFFLLALTGCSLFPAKKSRLLTLSKNSYSDIKKHIDKNCLTSSGAGRMVIGDEVHQFQYEALNQIEKSKWAMGFYFPLLGEEVLRLDYKNGKLQGSLYNKIYALVRQSEKLGDPELIISQIRGAMSVLFRLVKDIKESKFRERCEISKSDRKNQVLKFVCFDRFTGFEKYVVGKFESDKIYLSTKTDDSIEVRVEISDLHANKWRQTKVLLVKNAWWSTYELFSILLRAQKCES